MARHQSAKSKVELPIGVIAQLAMAFPLPLLSTDNRASWWKMPFSQFPFRVNEKANFENFLIKKWQNKKPSDWKCEGRGSCTILVIINNNSAGGLSPNGLMTLPTAGLTSVELKCLLSAVYCRRGNCSPPFSVHLQSYTQLANKQRERQPRVEKIRFPKMVILVINLMHSPIPNTFSMEPLFGTFTRLLAHWFPVIANCLFN